MNADFTIDLKTGTINPYQLDEVDWNVTLVNSGLHTMTGGRVKLMKPFIGNETFLLTYGDGLSDININTVHIYLDDRDIIISASGELSSWKKEAFLGDIFGSFHVKKYDKERSLHNRENMKIMIF